MIKDDSVKKKEDKILLNISCHGFFKTLFIENIKMSQDSYKDRFSKMSQDAQKRVLIEDF